MAVPELPESTRVIKSLFRWLVEMCGGPKEAAKIVGVDPALINRYYSRDNDRVPRCDIAFALEMHAGNPVMTRASAERQGYELLPKDAVGSITILNRHIADVTRTSANIIGALIEAQRDGTVCGWDRAVLTERINEAREVIALLEADISLSAGILPIRSRV